MRAVGGAVSILLLEFGVWVGSEIPNHPTTRVEWGAVLGCFAILLVSFVLFMISSDMKNL